jgi:DNA-binding transcriptional ArsR family regulator
VPVRIWFTAEDLARTRVALPDPYAETVYSTIALRGGPLADWRRHVRPRLGPALRSVLSGLPGRPMLDLVSVAGWHGGLEESLDGLLRAPAALQAEIDYVAAARGRMSPGVRHLLQTERGAPRVLARVLAAYHDVAVAPYWSRLRSHLEVERERVGRVLLDGGVERLFASLPGPGLCWQSPVLTVRSAWDRPDEKDDQYKLDGRGILLAPSVFFGPHAVYCRNLGGDRPDLLVYPAAPGPLVAARLWTDSSDPTLSTLLGSTRAKVLAAVGGGGSSTDLARRAGISLPSASEHARVLREGGLVRTERQGSAVRHRLTALGVQLLDRGDAG